MWKTVKNNKNGFLSLVHLVKTMLWQKADVIRVDYHHFMVDIDKLCVILDETI